MDLSIASALSPGSLAGNPSHLPLIASMAMRDIFRLHPLAIPPGLTGIARDVIWLRDPVGASRPGHGPGDR